MAVDLRRMQQLRDAAADWTSNNPTLLAGEIGIETDTGKFKIGPGAWNSLSYHASAWADITGKPSEFPPENHSASKITSGTVATARLPVATGSTVGVVKPGTGLEVDVDGVLDVTVSGGSGTDRGFFYDIRDYGAAVGAANAATNTDAVQDAIDAAAVQSGGWGGGTVYIPACQNEDTAMWDLQTPVWVHGLGLRVMGEGSRSTFVRSRGPAFILAKHPRYWKLWKTTYTDHDNANATVNTTVTASGTQHSTEWTTLSRYKPDLYQFRTGGTWPPTNGNPEFAPASISGAGQYFGIRTRAGVAQGFYPYCPLATGDKTQSGNSATTWPMHSKVTFEAIVYHHQTTLVGGICGAGFVATAGSGPDPWMLYGAGTDYYFEVALTDAEGIDRTWYRFTFPQNATIGIHRICVQFDPDNATDADRLIAWVDRTRATVTRTNISWYYGGQYHPLNSSVNGADNTGNLWTKWNRIARWQDAHFTVGAESVKTGHYASDQKAGLTDYTVLAVGVHADALYTNANSQTKVGGGGADDSTVWAMTSGNNVSTKSPLGWVANSYDISPDANAALSNNLRAWGKGWSDIWGSLVPKGDWENWGTYEASQDNVFEGFSIRQQSGFNVSCGLLLGPFLNQFRINDLNPAMYGFAASIGSLWNFVSYYGRFSNLKLNRQMHLIHMTVDAENVDFGYCPFTALRITGSEFRLRSFSYPAVDANTEGFLIATHGGALGAGITLKDGTINSESIHFAPNQVMLYTTKHYAHGNNKLDIDNVQFGDFGGPTIMLDDLNPTDSRPTTVKITGSGLSTISPMVIVRGKDWHGEIETGPDAYMATQIEYRDAVSGTNNFLDVKTIDNESYGIPPCGGFVHNAHEVAVRNPPEGGVAVWRASRDAAQTTVSYEQSSAPPDWTPVKFAESMRIQHALSANIFPGIRVGCTLPWPNANNPTTIAFSGMTLPWSRKCLATILANATAPTRTHSCVKWGYHSVFHTGTTTYQATFFSTPATANSGNWSSASIGSKATSANITATGADVPAWTIYRKRPWCGALFIGGSSVASSDSPDSAFVFKTVSRDPAHWVITNSDTAVVGSGNLTLARTTRSGGNWTYYASNQILDWMLDGSLSLGSTWYIGLSTTSVDTTLGTGATEPSGGSYARVAVTNASTWDEWYDSGFYANKVVIAFPSPTGTWGRVTHWFISDASSGGNIIAAGPLNRPIYVVSGDGQPQFRKGAFQIQL